ncbi:MAG: DUF2127 domain-containing protein [Candidatus Hodarchaeota archaeon]
MPFCKYCGQKTTDEAQFCPNCGAPVTVVASPTISPHRMVEASPLKTRPLGISILAVLEGIGSFFTLLGGIALLGLAALLSTQGGGNIPVEELEQAFQQIPWASIFASIPILTFTTTFFAVIGIILLLVAILGFIMVWGLWVGKRWAWSITLVLQGINIIMGIFSLPGSLISVLITCAIIYYLTRPYVKAYYR